MMHPVRDARGMSPHMFRFRFALQHPVEGIECVFMRDGMLDHRVVSDSRYDGAVVQPQRLEGTRLNR
jgi:hypothetical protein